MDEEKTALSSEGFNDGKELKNTSGEDAVVGFLVVGDSVGGGEIDGSEDGAWEINAFDGSLNLEDGELELSSNGEELGASDTFGTPDE